jgi:hypothetical protein
VGTIANRAYQHGALVHLNKRLRHHTAVEHPRRTIGETDEPGSDRAQLADFIGADRVGHRQWYPVRGHHDRVRYIRDPHFEIGNQPAQILIRIVHVVLR